MLNKKSDKIEKIYSATLKLVAEYGLHNTPMSKISKVSGVAVGTIYHHFPTKEDIINGLYICIKEELGEESFAGYDERDTYEGTLRLLWKNFYVYLIDNPDKLSFIEQCSTSPLITEENRRLGEEKLCRIMEFIKRGVDEKYFENSDSELIGWHFYGSVSNIAKYTLYIGRPLGTEVIEDTISMCLNGIKRQG